MLVEVATDFEPNQIVCLDHEQDCLYAEVIQVVKHRQLCWARPLLLSLGSPNYLQPQSEINAGFKTAAIVHDLRRSADLLWPLGLFRPALDTEVIPLLARLNDIDGDSGNDSKRQLLNGFTQKVWQAHPHQFQMSS